MVFLKLTTILVIFCICQSSINSSNTSQRNKRKLTANPTSSTKPKDDKFVEVDALTNEPFQAWEKLSKIYKSKDVVDVKSLLKENLNENERLRIVCWSDTHAAHREWVMPDGDVFLHAGDFSIIGRENGIKDFGEWLVGLKHKHKIVISGNHDKDEQMNRKLLKDKCEYLHDSSTTIYGIKFYGTAGWNPARPEGGNRIVLGYELPRGQALLEKWNKIPNDTDILVTHTPPVGHGDLCVGGTVRAGCVELLTTIEKRLTKLKYNVFGHIHDGYGVTTNGKVFFLNVANQGPRPGYVSLNPPIVFDIKLPIPKDQWSDDGKTRKKPDTDKKPVKPDTDKKPVKPGIVKTRAKGAKNSKNRANAKSSKM